ncbi:hypothetical protein L2750_14575 [Shewanella submarina]|uniref:Uncharacterized protein n=1 Tax=Shewanella submarina TaxID=2016376 RepID=A0ABV7G858_9GAMM|nr:hypothetical protein [Shewanella submarina]MCL1038356.1 hypothetical protein [Shewanella submarina]
MKRAIFKNNYPGKRFFLAASGGYIISAFVILTCGTSAFLQPNGEGYAECASIGVIHKHFTSYRKQWDTYTIITDDGKKMQLPVATCALLIG